MSDKLYPVILTGGSGTRLWPLSRAALPKQLLPLVSADSLLQETLRRLKGVPELAPPVVICNEEHRFLIAEQLLQIGSKPLALVLEPEGRNTAPAVAIAALLLEKEDPDALMLVLAADHVIADISAFHAAIEKARSLAKQEYLALFGITPTTPETGYGYIRRGAALESDAGAYEVAEFVEKPSAEVAAQYVESGDYFWNSGMFLFSAKTFLEELHRLAPDTEQYCREALEPACTDLDFLRLSPAFLNCRSEPVDCAIMERTTRAAMVPTDIGWSDIGSWSALWEYLPKDESGNVCRGEVVTHDVSNCFLQAENRMIAAVGVSDLIIVETPDVILVTHTDTAQDVKKLVDTLRAQGRAEPQVHRKVFRPWGYYEGMDQGERFQVKRLTVNPGAHLSLQKHHHRAEHWVVVSGTAEVTIDEKVTMLGENQSIFVPLGSMHRLHNPGRIPLHIIEVQSGAYLGEDDIVRTEDIYGR